MTILSFLWTYRQTVLAALAGAVVGMNIGWPLGHWIGTHDGRATLKNEIAAQSIVVKEKQIEIRNNRPDTDTLVKRLRAGDF